MGLRRNLHGGERQVKRKKSEIRSLGRIVHRYIYMLISLYERECQLNHIPHIQY